MHLQTRDEGGTVWEDVAISGQDTIDYAQVGHLCKFSFSFACCLPVGRVTKSACRYMEQLVIHQLT